MKKIMTATLMVLALNSATWASQHKSTLTCSVAGLNDSELQGVIPMTANLNNGDGAIDRRSNQHKISAVAINGKIVTIAMEDLASGTSVVSRSEVETTSASPATIVLKAKEQMKILDCWLE